MCGGETDMPRREGLCDCAFTHKIYKDKVCVEQTLRIFGHRAFSTRDVSDEVLQRTRKMNLGH